MFVQFLDYVVAFSGSYENYCFKVIIIIIIIIIIINPIIITFVVENILSLIILAKPILDINIGHKILQ
jgi:hypothetical protein